MSCPIQPSGPGAQGSVVNPSSSRLSQAPEVNEPPRVESTTGTVDVLAQASSNTWRTLPLNKLDEVSTLTQIYPKEGQSVLLPFEVNLRTFNLGIDGPKLQIAENIGATPVQIKTADGKDLLWSPIAADNYKRELNGAGSIGGIPIVGPAGRLAYGEQLNPGIFFEGSPQLGLNQSWLGKEGRIAKDANGLITHGAIYTSDKWKLTQVRTLGDQAQNGIELTYRLPLQDKDSDVVVDAFVNNKKAIEGSASVELRAKPGYIEATYRLTKDEKGNPKFNSEIRINPGEGDMMLLGSVAQHTFLASQKGDMLQTNANNEYEAREGRPELPTGKLIEIQPKHNFNEARSVHKDQDAAGPLEVVLTGYQNGVEATLIREGDLRIKSKASGDYDGFLL